VEVVSTRGSRGARRAHGHDTSHYNSTHLTVQFFVTRVSTTPSSTTVITQPNQKRRTAWDHCRVAAIDPCGKDSRHQDIRDTVIAITVELTCASERDATRETHADRGLYWLTKAYPRAKHGASGKRNFTRVSRVSRRRVIRYGGPPYGIHSYIENIQYDIHTPTTTRSSRGHGVREVRNGLRPDSRLLPDRRYRRVCCLLLQTPSRLDLTARRTRPRTPDFATAV
jgi:hypothetical protein